MSKDEQVIQIEGNPDTARSRSGRLCPKGSASRQLVTGPQRVQKVLYRPPHGTAWQELDLDTAMDMIADRVLDARRKGWQDTDGEGEDPAPHPWASPASAARPWTTRRTT